MGDTPELSAGDEWPNHYRGFSLQISPNGDVWWQLYNGTDRLTLSSFPTDLVEKFLELKHLGGRIHITENGDVLTRMEDNSSEDEYVGIYVGNIELEGELVPKESPEYSIPLRPEGLSTGDLWPSVYDGSRYSFVGQRVWWQNSTTHRRHMVSDGVSQEILQTLRQYKSSGGSFRITPWGDVITLVPSHPAPGTVREQFGDLPRIVQNIIKLRKERDVEMLPIYVGTLEDVSVEVKEPRSLTDELSDEEEEALASWASGLGTTSTTTTSAHKTTEPERSADDTSKGAGSADDDIDSEDDLPRFDDDPVEWIEDDIENGRD